MNFIEIMRYHVYDVLHPKKVKVKYWPEGFYLYQDVDTGSIISHNPDGTEEPYKPNYIDIIETGWEVCGELPDQTDKFPYRLDLETGRIYRADGKDEEDEPEDEEDELGPEDIENITDLPYNPYN